MTITIPGVAVNYQSPLLFFPTKWQNESPPEGPGGISCEIDWGTMGGASNVVFVSPQNNTASNQSMSQIVALCVDNSGCGGDCEFLFPDTSDILTMPAGSPRTISPIFTNGSSFYVSCPTAEPGDVTRFQLLNTLPPPLSVAGGFEQEAGVSTDIPNDGATGGTLIADNISGYIENLNVYVTAADASAGGSYVYTFQDGNSNIIAGFQVAVPEAGNINALVLNLQGVKLRFINGLTLVASGGDTELGHISINLYYKSPSS